MNIDINGRNATVEVPATHMLMDAIIITRIVNISDPSDATISIGCTDHTDPVIQAGILDVFEQHRIRSFVLEDDDDE